MNVYFSIYVVFGFFVPPVAFLAGTVMQRDGASLALGLGVTSVVGIVYLALLVVFTFRGTLKGVEDAIEEECKRETPITVCEA